MVIRDITLTLQTVDIDLLLRVGNVVVPLIEAVGGVRSGSIKIEYATHFAILHGVDYNASVPPVLETVELRKDLAHLDSKHLGSMKIDLEKLTRQTHERARTAPHEDKAAQFRRIWERTEAN